MAHRAAAGVVALVVGSASTADAARSKPKPSDEAARTTPSVLSFFQAKTLAQRSAEKVKALAGIAERAAAKMKALAQETTFDIAAALAEDRKILPVAIQLV
ncbi:hypothetical protein M885DRAFT_569350 [Pelagophyceae sp. CCMP2097]|nr:hypothetical protein M885DRAFT_569350 [Pelagophyceae sp. CCMP2097]